jgi:hypothetical protein
VIIPLMAVVGLLLPVVLGGDLRRLATVRIRSVWLIVVAFLVQLMVISVLSGPVPVLQAVHVATYVAAGWTIWVNRAVPGVALLGLGALSNGVTIAVNGGTLPASPAALRTAGLTDDSGFVNSGVLAHPHLAALGDVFAIPASWPLANVFSIGDVLIVLGVWYASVRICGTRATRPWGGPPPVRPPPPRSPVGSGPHCRGSPGSWSPPVRRSPPRTRQVPGRRVHGEGYGTPEGRQTSGGDAAKQGGARFGRTLTWLRRVPWLAPVGGVAWLRVVDLSTSGEVPSGILVLVLALLFVCLVVSVGLVAAVSPQRRIALAALALGLLFWASGSAVLNASTQPSAIAFPAPGEWLFLSAYVGFSTFLVLDRAGASKAAAGGWLDAVIVVGGAACVALVLLVTPFAGRLGDQDVPLLVALLYPLLDVTLLLLVVGQVALRQRSGTWRPAALCGGFAVLAVADASLVASVASGSYQYGQALDLAWCLGFLLVVDAACSTTDAGRASTATSMRCPAADGTTRTGHSPKTGEPQRPVHAVVPVLADVHDEARGRGRLDTGPLPRRDDRGQGRRAPARGEHARRPGGQPDDAAQPADDLLLEPGGAGRERGERRVRVQHRGQEVGQRRGVQAAARQVGEVSRRAGVDARPADRRPKPVEHVADGARPGRDAERGNDYMKLPTGATAGPRPCRGTPGRSATVRR